MGVRFQRASSPIPPAVEDVTRAPGIELPSQPALVRVESAGPALRPESPHVSEQLLLREHSMRLRREGAQERVLLVGELHLTPGDLNPAPDRIQPQVPDPDRPLPATTPPPEDNRHPGEQLRVVERLEE